MSKGGALMDLFVQALMKACQAAVLSPETRRELQVVLLYHQVVTISGDRMTLARLVTISEQVVTSV